MGAVPIASAHPPRWAGGGGRIFGPGGRPMTPARSEAVPSSSLSAGRLGSRSALVGKAVGRPIRKWRSREGMNSSSSSRKGRSQPAPCSRRVLQKSSPTSQSTILCRYDRTCSPTTPVIVVAERERQFAQRVYLMGVVGLEQSRLLLPANELIQLLRGPGKRTASSCGVAVISDRMRWMSDIRRTRHQLHGRRLPRRRNYLLVRLSPDCRPEPGRPRGHHGRANANRHSAHLAVSYAAAAARPAFTKRASGTQ